MRVLPWGSLMYQISFNHCILFIFSLLLIWYPIPFILSFSQEKFFFKVWSACVSEHSCPQRGCYVTPEQHTQMQSGWQLHSGLTAAVTLKAAVLKLQMNYYSKDILTSPNKKTQNNTHCDYESKNYKHESEPDFQLRKVWIIGFPLKGIKEHV